MNQQSFDRTLVELLRRVVRSLDPEADVQGLRWDVPKDPSFGDLSTPVAFKLAARKRQPPPKIAAELAALVQQEAQSAGCSGWIERCEAKGGFVNVYLSLQALLGVVRQILADGGAYGRTNVGGGQSVLLEFVSANPTGPLSVAHGRQAAVGDALGRILRTQGYAVTAEYLINDEGRQIDLLGRSLQIRYAELFGRTDSIPDGGYRGAYMTEMAEAFRQQHGDGYLPRLGQGTLDEFVVFSTTKLLERITQDLERFGLRYDAWVSQRWLRTSGKIDQALAALGARGMLYDAASPLPHRLQDLLPDVSEDERRRLAEALRSAEPSAEQIPALLEGRGITDKRIHQEIQDYVKDAGTAQEATWFASTRFGDDKDRVVRKRDGELTYLAPDIAYHQWKCERGYDLMVNLWGPDHHGYIARVKAAVAALGFDAARLTVRIVQLVTLLRDGKPVVMSKREGDIVTLVEVMDEVGTDATRFFYCMRTMDSHLEFDLTLAKAKVRDNPVYYVQYAHARICSVLSVAQKQMPEPAAAKAPEDASELERLVEPEERLLMRHLALFPRVLASCALLLEPHGLTGYLQKLAELFHVFYTKQRVITEDAALSRARLVLVRSARQVLANGLGLLGVSAPEQM